MKTKLLLAIALLSTLQIFAQTNGWYLYTKASTIYKIVPDDTNANELHLATDIGYIKYNTSSNMVTGSLNLTTQNPAIGHVNGLSLNPTNTDIALALDDGIAIYDGTTVTIYNYTNSALTVGSVGGAQFTKLEVRYGRQGELYIFKPDVTGYQIFNAGVFDAEVVTAIRPQDIIENQAGTKVFFAGWNDGLHMLEKATTTWTNYTTSSSVLITNSLLTLQVDASDVLYIGSFQGLNTMDSSGVWDTYQQSAPPPNAAFFLPVYEISVDETTGGLLIRTSKPSTSFFGVSTVDLTTNTWINYTSDNTNCLNANVFTATTFDANGKIYAAPQDNSNPGQFIEFAPGTNTCTPLDINYLNALAAVNSGVIRDFTVRKKASGNLDIGFTKGVNLHILEIDPVTFIGSFTIGTTIVPVAAPGASVFNVIADNDFFIVETNAGWVFVDGANNATEFSHNLPNYLALGTKKAAAFDSSDGIIDLIFKGFDAAFNYRVYKTQCNTATGTCSVPEEMFTTNRDLTQNIFFGTHLNPITNIVSVAALKTVSPATGKFTEEASKNKNVPMVAVHGGVAFESYDHLLNDPPGLSFDEAFTEPGGFLERDPDLLDAPNNEPPVLIYSLSELIYGVRTTNALGDSFFTDFTNDANGDGFDDDFVDISDHQFPSESERKRYRLIAAQALSNGNDLSIQTKLSSSSNVNILPKGLFITAVEIESINEAGLPTFKTTNIPSATIDNDLPDDLFIAGVKSVQYSTTEMLLMFLTNYGVLIKTGIDISNLTLSVDDVSLKDSNLLLYPNPANDMVSFSDNSIKTITVYDINGRKVLSTTNSNSFSVKTLAQGIYIVKGTSDNNVVVTKKLVVE
jgi:Secretion system C-terminal sorting domain